MNKSVQVLRLGVRDEFLFKELPAFNPKVISFECIDPRICRCMRHISNTFELQEGELFPYKTPGGVSDLVYGTEAVKAKCFEAIRLTHKHGANKVWLVAHTGCASDKERFPALTDTTEDVKIQEHKLLTATSKVLDYSNQFNLDLKVVPILVHIQSTDIKVIILDHGLVDHNSPDSQDSALVNAIIGNNYAMAV